MPFPIEKKLVVGISSNALFNLEKEDEIYKTKGLEEYKKYQIENKLDFLSPGLGFPFIKRFLKINETYHDLLPVEVVLLSKNSPETGIRIFNSIKHHHLNITRAAFTSGVSPYEYIPSFNISLFLTTDIESVNQAIKKGYPAGYFIKTDVVDDPTDLDELRVAFDFDGVLADDEAEKIYHEQGIEKYYEYETAKQHQPHNPGLMAEFFKKLSYFQKLEAKKKKEDATYKKIIRTSIITARNAPAHERAINTLSAWEVDVDDMFLLGGIDKSRILKTLKPHLYIDDQKMHLDSKTQNIPLVHIPFGVTNAPPSSV